MALYRFESIFARLTKAMQWDTMMAVRYTPEVFMPQEFCSACHPCDHVSELPGERDVALLAEFFRTMGSDTRLKILLALDGHEMCAGHLAQVVGMAPSAVSNQLRALRQARLITVRREGKMLYYSLADCHPQQIIHLAMSHVRETEE